MNGDAGYVLKETRAYMSEEDRKAELISIFIKAFCKYGLDGTTTKKLAEEANLSEAGLYVYFKNKEDILLKCVDWHLRSVRCGIDELVRKYGNKPETFVLSVFAYTKSMLLENRFIFQVLSHPHYGETIKKSRNNVLDGFKEQMTVPLKACVSKETAFAAALLFNSALNNYILTQDEESFHIQTGFLLKIFET